MNILKATKRTTASTGQINRLRSDGFIPAILYGGKKNNINISLKKLHVQDIIKTETFMSKVVDLDIDGSAEKVLPRDITPGLKKGGVLNTVRRKVELKCPAENIPNEIIVDLDNTEIGSSLKISSVKLPNNVVPTITGRDFVIATVASPTIVIEPEKTEETAAEGEAAAVGAEGATEGTVDGEAKTEDGKEKVAKPSDDKSKSAPSEKAQSPNKEKETKKK